MADKDKNPETPETKILRLAKKIKVLEERIDFYDFVFRQGRHNGPVPKKRVAAAYWRYCISWVNYRLTKVQYPDQPVQWAGLKRDMEDRHAAYQKIKRDEARPPRT